jgi:hypothetical protein
MQDERATQAAALFHQAHRLLDDLIALRRRLPEPNMPIRGPLPPDWNQFRSYAVCLETLAISLRQALWNIDKGLEFRNEWRIRDALMPPSAKFRLPGDLWLNSFDRPDEEGQR